MLIRNSSGLVTIDPKIVLPKPQSSIKPDALAEVTDRGDLLITRKRDGHSAPVVIAGSKTGDIRILTAGYNDNTDKFPHVVESLRALQFPSNSVVQGEMLLTNTTGADDRMVYQRVAMSGVERALAVQDELGLTELVLFNLWQIGGVSMIESPYQSRFDRLGEQLDKYAVPHISLVEVIGGQLADVQDRSNREGWEGLVLYDRMAGSKVRTDGKSELIPRPDGCWKWKPINEDDFVVTGFRVSTAAAHVGGVRDFKIAQYDRETGKLVPCGVVGKGFSREDRMRYANESLYPLVAEIEFEQRTEANKLTHSKLVRFRTDKAPEQCLLPA